MVWYIPLQCTWAVVQWLWPPWEETEEGQIWPDHSVYRWPAVALHLCPENAIEVGRLWGAAQPLQELGKPADLTGISFQLTEDFSVFLKQPLTATFPPLGPDFCNLYLHPCPPPGGIGCTDLDPCSRGLSQGVGVACTGVCGHRWAAPGL